MNAGNDDNGSDEEDSSGEDIKTRREATTADRVDIYNSSIM